MDIISLMELIWREGGGGGGVIVRRQPCPPARPIFYYNIHEINTSMYGSVPFKHSVVRLSRPNHTHTHTHLHTHPGADQGIPETGGGVRVLEKAGR